MRAVAAGASIARFGDGEFKMIYGAGYVREPPNLRLSTELFETLKAEAPGLLIAIPTMDPAGPKFASWDRHRERFVRIVPEDATFYSAFVTRPDSAPWILTAEYLALVESVWAGRRVAIVCHGSNKLLQVVRATARSTVHIGCPFERAYSGIGRLEREVAGAGVDVAVLSVGPTATCLARRLHARGIQALDFGSAGGFLAKLRGRQCSPS